MARIDLPGVRNGLTIDIPEDYLGEIVTPSRMNITEDPIATIRAALSRPIGTPCLEQLVRPENRVAVMVDDITRDTPTAIVLPLILKALSGSGVPREKISVVVALGTHRPMTSNEIDRKIGSSIARNYRVVNVPAGNSNEMVYVGKSSRGIPAWVNRAVVETDFRIGIGMIMPHLDAGYGGGAKIVLPGVCSEATVAAFHSQMAGIDTNQLGLENAALRLDLEQWVGECMRLDFILNVILDCRGNLYRCVAGDAVQAHRAGIRFAREVYGASVKRRYPLVIANAYPHQIDFWQSTKALASGEIVTQSGGTLILVADCPEGHGTHPRFAEYIGMDLDDLLGRFNGGEIPDRCAAAEAVAVGRMKQRIRIGLVSSGLSAEEVREMGFSYYPSVETAIAETIGPMQEKKIGVLTHGGLTLPLLPD